MTTWQSPEMVTCPVNLCRHMLPKGKTTQISAHISTHEANDNALLADNEYNSLGVVRCWQCIGEVKLYTSKKYLENHVKKTYK